jgi:hypothetical protein
MALPYQAFQELQERNLLPILWIAWFEAGQLGEQQLCIQDSSLNRNLFQQVNIFQSLAGT